MFVPFSFARSSPQNQAPSPISPHTKQAAFTTSSPLQSSHQGTPVAWALEGQNSHGEECSHSGTYRNARTRGQFKPRNTNKGTSSYQLRQFAEATLGSESLRKAVKLPDGEDLNEWLAVNGNCSHVSILLLLINVRLVVDFYNQINLLYGSITEFCSPQSCPEMKATDECVDWSRSNVQRG